MDETLKEMKEAIEAYRNGPQAAQTTASAVDLGLLELMLPYLIKLWVKDAVLQARFLAFAPNLVAFVEEFIRVFFPQTGGDTNV